MDEPVTRAEVDALRLEVEHLGARVDELYRATGLEVRDPRPPTIAAQLDACREDRRRRRERAAAS